MTHGIHAVLNYETEPERINWLFKQRKAGINPTDTVRGLIDRAIESEKTETETETEREN